ncbi:hypothetical protein SK355_09720 [Candidatus Fukatsuia symbiotica]|uniref:Uncharacterized protein n=1 Tax=Candidatus Fukatsuia symbiotica TaxID=1878942 RepID=A0A2U8I3G4_9GAMM|nr:hypothetical protein [Candidatus Fukatsuia symbiotica]AWK13667.1 hypothetical protein CCS41_02845 [Candidatus Fukatsuia symbiotica]AWK14057.1 hypothetical protein CCS41_05480 [Candidatus Fukatsuia symbiotica]AWK14151.1 hypothetical protein CCS41_06120 [Candidatus Fukatsuia symbiotica]MEA9445493.1 hypothetical protein [Candidatus Fukatsuia symbiotica]
MLQDVMKEPSEMIYIGAILHQALETFAASVSAHCGYSITAAHFAQYLIDHYGEIAKDTIIATLKN